MPDGVNEFQAWLDRIQQQRLELTRCKNQFRNDMSAALSAIAEARKRAVEEQVRLEEAQRRTEEHLQALIAFLGGTDRRGRRRPPRRTKK